MSAVASRAALAPRASAIRGPSNSGGHWTSAHDEIARAVFDLCFEAGLHPELEPQHIFTTLLQPQVLTGMRRGAGAWGRAPGVWGPYRGAPLMDLAMSEGGQSTTGAALQWARRIFGDVSFDDLEAEAEAWPVGGEGCAALGTVEGARRAD